MQPQKVYESAVYLLSNLIADEKLRYELSITETLKEKVIILINEMLYLEFDHHVEMNGTKFAPIFAKAYVNITKEKTEFEKPSNSSVEKVYSSYSELIAYLVTKFNADKHKIESTNIKPNEDEIKLNARITADMKEKYKQPEPDLIQKSGQKQDSMKYENKSNLNEQNLKENSNTESGSNNFNYFGKSIVNPLQDPRFYPYNKKVKGMKWIRMSLAIVAILMAVFFMAFYTFAISQKINIDASDKFSSLFNGWKPVNANDKFDYSKNINLLNYTFSRGFSTGTYGLILSYFYGIAAIATFIYFTFFLPIKIPAEGFRLQLTLYIILILFLVLNLFETTSFFDIDKFIKVNMKNYFSSVFYNKENASYPIANFNSDFETLWSEVTRQTKTVVWTLLAVITSVFCFIAVIFGTVVVIINPKRDREKIMRAVMSYQQAMAAAMAGTPYSIDESLYDKDLIAILDAQRLKKENKSKVKKDEQKD